MCRSMQRSLPVRYRRFQKAPRWSRWKLPRQKQVPCEEEAVLLFREYQNRRRKPVDHPRSPGWPAFLPDEPFPESQATDPPVRCRWSCNPAPYENRDWLRQRAGRKRRKVNVPRSDAAYVRTACPSQECSGLCSLRTEWCKARLSARCCRLQDPAGIPCARSGRRPPARPRRKMRRPVNSVSSPGSPRDLHPARPLPGKRLSDPAGSDSRSVERLQRILRQAVLQNPREPPEQVLQQGYGHPIL